MGGRIKVAGGEGHILEDGARVCCVVGKNGTFTVGNAVFGRAYEQRNRSFNLDKREKTESDVKTLDAHVFRDRRASAALTEIFGNLVHAAAATSAVVVSVGELYVENDG